MAPPPPPLAPPRHRRPLLLPAIGSVNPILSLLNLPPELLPRMHRRILSDTVLPHIDIARAGAASRLLRDSLAERSSGSWGTSPRCHGQRQCLELGRRKLLPAWPRRFLGRRNSCRRRSKPWLTIALLPCRLGGATASQSVTADGAVWSWGDGGEGCLGRAAPRTRSSRCRGRSTRPSVVDVSAGRHSLATTTAGDFYLFIPPCRRLLPVLTAATMWFFFSSCGAEGQLGHLDTRNQWRPKKIEALSYALSCAGPRGGGSYEASDCLESTD